jgi:hypothetical protein
MKLSRILACGESTHACSCTNRVCAFALIVFLNRTADYENILSMQGMLALAVRGTEHLLCLDAARSRRPYSLRSRGLSRSPCMLTGCTGSDIRGFGVVFRIARFPNEHPNTRTMGEYKSCDSRSGRAAGSAGIPCVFSKCSFSDRYIRLREHFSSARNNGAGPLMRGTGRPPPWGRTPATGRRRCRSREKGPQDIDSKGLSGILATCNRVTSATDIWGTLRRSGRGAGPPCCEFPPRPRARLRRMRLNR